MGGRREKRGKSISLSNQRVEIMGPINTQLVNANKQGDGVVRETRDISDIPDKVFFLSLVEI